MPFRAYALPVWWAACFALTHLSFGPSLGPQLPLIDKFVHFTLYLGLAVLWRVRRAARVRPQGGAAAATFFAILLVYAAFDEISQAYVGRDTEALDFAADALGAAAGLAFPLRRAARGTR